MQKPIANRWCIAKVKKQEMHSNMLAGGTELDSKETTAKHTTHTVTRIDVIFRYPDRVPLTHFVHRAKKVLSM